MRAKTVQNENECENEEYRMKNWERFLVSDWKNRLINEIDFLLKIKIEVAVEDGKLDDALRAISKAAFTGKIGDGKIFVASLHDAVRIRTGESGQQAL